jgi:YD repeat-containing protein
MHGRPSRPKNRRRRVAARQTRYTVGDNNQTLSDGTYSDTYEAEGNRLSRTRLADGAVVQYSWDYRNRLVGIVERNALQEVVETVTYRYDPLNRRMAKEVAPAFGPSTVEHFLYDAGAGAIDGDQQIAWQFQSGGTVTNRYLHGPAVDQVLADEQVGGSTAQVL